MKKEERLLALRTLAMKYPNLENIGTLWKNPLNSRSRGIRWTRTDLEIFRKFQVEFS